MERFWAKVDASGPCWLWTAGQDGHGYGSFAIDRRSHKAHRVAWQLLVGEIPPGLVVDHLCRNRLCVNPDHMELVTPGENTRRGYGGATRQRIKTHCPQGHSYAEHTYVLPSRPTARYCQMCNIERSRRNRAANNEASRRYRARKKAERMQAMLDIVLPEAS